MAGAAELPRSPPRAGRGWRGGPMASDDSFCSERGIQASATRGLVAGGTARLRRGGPKTAIAPLCLLARSPFGCYLAGGGPSRPGRPGGAARVPAVDTRVALGVAAGRAESCPAALWLDQRGRRTCRRPCGAGSPATAPAPSGGPRAPPDVRHEKVRGRRRARSNAPFCFYFTPRPAPPRPALRLGADIND